MMPSPDSLAMSSHAQCPAAVLITLLQLFSLCCFLEAEGHRQTLAGVRYSKAMEHADCSSGCGKHTSSLLPEPSHRRQDYYLRGTTQLLDLGYTTVEAYPAFFKPLPSQLLGERRRAQRIIPMPPPVPRFDTVPTPSPAPPLPRFHKVPRPSPAPPSETWNQLMVAEEC